MLCLCRYIYLPREEIYSCNEFLNSKGKIFGYQSLFFFKGFLIFDFILFFFLPALGLRCRVRASHCGGFSCCGARALGWRASVVVAHGFSSCSLRALEHRLSSCGTRAQLLRGMWDLPGPGIKPVSPALASGFLNHCATREVLAIGLNSVVNHCVTLIQCCPIYCGYGNVLFLCCPVWKSVAICHC